MKKFLLKDIVIPAGTAFEDAPHTTTRGEGAIEAIIGLTKDSSGSFVYYLDRLDPALGEWFGDEPPEQPKKLRTPNPIP